MKKLLHSTASGVLLISFLTTVFIFTPIEVDAQSRLQDEACTGAGGTWTNGECVSDEGGNDLVGIINTAINILLSIAGAVAVIMLIIGGFRYVVSSGDSSAVEDAKNTILYAIIGLVVIFLSYAVVNVLIRELIS